MITDKQSHSFLRDNPREIAQREQNTGQKKGGRETEIEGEREV